jgi:hypothetical protein
MPGRTIEVPMPGWTITEGAGTDQDQAQRIVATAGTVTVIAGTIDWFAAFATRSSPRMRSAARGPLFVDSLLRRHGPRHHIVFGVRLWKRAD